MTNERLGEKTMNPPAISESIPKTKSSPKRLVAMLSIIMDIPETNRRIMKKYMIPNVVEIGVNRQQKPPIVSSTPKKMIRIDILNQSFR